MNKKGMINHYTLNWTWQTGEPGRVGSIRLPVKTGLSQSGYWSSQVNPYFSHEFFFFFFNKEHMYLPFRKSCNKLLNVKYIILNSPLISRMNSVKLINIYSIILKLYKS